MIREDIVSAIKKVFDPEIPVNVWDLGLIYAVNIRGKKVSIDMTLTSPMCPIADEMVAMVRFAGESVAGVGNVNVNLVWDPPWSIAKMSDAAKLELDLTAEGW